MTITAGTVVSMNYKLTNSKGEEIDQNAQGKPFEYLHGASQIVPGLESALEGLNVGQRKTVVVPPAEGYGEVNKDLIAQVSRSQFPEEMEIVVGMQFKAQLEHGPMILRVEGVNGDEITVDGNHPLAGQTLNFDIEIVSIRKASDEELAHGHAHGPDGHHH